MKIWLRTGLMLLLASAFAVNALAASVKLSWTAPQQQTGVVISKFNIYRATVSGAQTTSGVAWAATPDGSTLTWTDLNVQPGTYFYKVTAVCAVCPAGKQESALSNETQAVVPAQVIIIQPPIQQPPQVILP